MDRIARFVLVCLLSLAIPLKVLAASSIMGCNPGGHHAHQTVALAGSSLAMALPGVDHHGADHASTHAHHDASPAEHDHAPGGAAPADGQAKVKCSACAPCSSPVAPNSFTLSLPAVDPIDQLAPTPDAPIVGVVADVPRKPPRPILA